MVLRHLAFAIWRHSYARAECKRWARARRYERLSACWICSVRVRCTAVPAAGLSYVQHGCRSTEPSVPATGGEPVAWRRSGQSPSQHPCSCGATAAHCWSQRADKLPVATSSREACGPQAAPAAAAVPPSEHEQQRECACPAAQQVTRANKLSPTACPCSARRFLQIRTTTTFENSNNSVRGGRTDNCS